MMRLCITSTERNNNSSTDSPLGVIEEVVSLDEQLTLRYAVCANPTSPSLKVLKYICYLLELSGHGVIWFILVGLLLAAYLWSNEPFCYVYGMNLLYLLVIDIVFVAPIKLLFKRPRPSLNPGSIPLSVSNVDTFAFPSGHASRCVALAAFFCYMPPFYLRTHLWYIWALVMSVSRILLGRHHISDVLAGMCAGMIIFEIVRRTVLLEF